MALNATIRLRAITKKDLNALLELAEQVAKRVTVDAFPTDEKPEFPEPASTLRVMVVRRSPAGVEEVNRPVVRRNHAR